MKVKSRLIRRHEVEVRTGLSTSTIYRLMRSGDFPSPVRVGKKAVRWAECEIDEWLAGLPRATGEHPPAA